VSGVLQLVALAIPILGIVLMLVNLAKRTTTIAWQRTEGRPIGRVVVVLAGAAAVGLLLLAWLPRANYAPIRRGEKGTLGEGVAAVRNLPRGDGPLESERIAQRAGRISATDDPGSTTDANPAGSTTDPQTVSDTTTTSVETATTTTTLAHSTATTTRMTSATSTTSVSTTSTSLGTTSTTEPAVTTTTAP